MKLSFIPINDKSKEMFAVSYGQKLPIKSYIHRGPPSYIARRWYHTRRLQYQMPQKVVVKKILFYSSKTCILYDYLIKMPSSPAHLIYTSFSLHLIMSWVGFKDEIIRIKWGYFEIVQVYPLSATLALISVKLWSPLSLF